MYWALLFADFSKAFDSIYREKIYRLLLAYGLAKETVKAIIMFYRNAKFRVRSPDEDSLLRHFCWSSARGFICTKYANNLPRLHITSIDLIKDNGFTLK